MILAKCDVLINFITSFFSVCNKNTWCQISETAILKPEKANVIIPKTAKEFNSRADLRKL